MNSVADFLNAELTLVKRCAPSRTKIGNYISIGDFVLQNGRKFTPATKLPKDVRLGKLGLCFRQAAELAIANPDYIYCEGYAAGVIPLLHGWCVDKDGNVIDPTWCRKDRHGDSFMGHTYFGVPFKTKFLMEQICRNQSYGLIDQWEKDWPVLRADPKDFLYVLCF